MSVFVVAVCAGRGTSEEGSASKTFTVQECHISEFTKLTHVCVSTCMAVILPAHIYVYMLLKIDNLNKETDREYFDSVFLQCILTEQLSSLLVTRHLECVLTENHFYLEVKIRQPFLKIKK